MQYTRNDYTIGWICALPVELAAAIAVLDEEHPRLPMGAHDCNIYRFGQIHSHNIVIAPLPSGVIGTSSAAAVAARVCADFPRLRFTLMVGVGGGAPSGSKDIRLGDVV